MTAALDYGFALAIAGGVTCLVALAMVLRHPTRLGVIGVIGALALCAVIGSLAIDTTPQPAAAIAPLKVTAYAVDRYQLETLALP